MSNSKGAKWSRAFGLSLFAWLTVATLSADLEEETFVPEISVEQAAITARRAMAQNRFNSENFEIRSITYKRQLIPTEAEVEKSIKEGIARDADIEIMKGLRANFGDGPGWKVTFWRTKKVSNVGLWSDDLGYGVTVFVFSSNKAAVLDQRIPTDPSDMVGPATTDKP